MCVFQSRDFDRDGWSTFVAFDQIIGFITNITITILIYNELDFQLHNKYRYRYKTIKETCISIFITF